MLRRNEPFSCSKRWPKTTSRISNRLIAGFRLNKRRILDAIPIPVKRRMKMTESSKSEVLGVDQEVGPSALVNSKNHGPASRVGVLFAENGQYEEYRARIIEVYESIEAAKTEADRRNALIPTAREAIRAAWDLPDDQFALTGKREKRILNKLRRETGDAEIENYEIGDLTYTVTEARLVR